MGKNRTGDEVLAEVDVEVEVEDTKNGFMTRSNEAFWL
jgi:hypothetical protein